MIARKGTVTGSATIKWLEEYSVSLSWTLVFLVLIANSVLSYMNFSYVVESSQHVKLQYERIIRTNQLLTLLVDAETGHRGYLITGKSSYLEPYNNSLKLLDEQLPVLHETFQEDPLQREEADKIINLVHLKLQEMKSILDVRNSQGYELARERVTQDLGKKYMDEVRDLIQVMTQQERSKLNSLSQKVAESRTRAWASLIAGSIVMVGMSVAVFALVRKQLKYRTRMEHLLRQKNNELEQRVQHRTEALLFTNISLQDEIVERKRLEEQAVKLAMVLQSSNSELEQFASIASHDLQEPLRKIQAFSDRLLGKYRERLDDMGKEYIDRIQYSAGRMRNLIEDLLTFSRVSSKGKPFVPVDLNEVIQGVLVDLEIRIQETRASILVDSLPTIEADQLQMRQLFQNLLGNALKFHRPGVIPQIQVKWRNAPNSILDEPDCCELIFSDNGIGFDNQYAERIFQLFQRLHGRTDYEGTGLGLAICKKIVERHGGTIKAEGLSGSGATFSIRLPMTHPTPARKD